MDSSLYLIGLIVVLIVVGGPILAILAFTRVRHLEQTSAQIPQLTSRIYSLEQRLARIESTLATASVADAESKVAAPQKISPPVSAPEQAPPGPVASVTPPSQTPPVVTPITPSQPVPRQSIHAAPPSFSLGASALKAGKSEPVHFENLIAGRWMPYIGILAILFADTFFLTYAFEIDWIGPRGRVAIGLLIGPGLFPFSQRLLDRGYKYFSEGIAGLGAAVLYLSLWAGWHYYGVFSQTSAFAMMIAVAALATVVGIGSSC